MPLVIALVLADYMLHNVTIITYYWNCLIIYKSTVRSTAYNSKSTQIYIILPDTKYFFVL